MPLFASGGPCAETREGGSLEIDIDDHSQRLTLDIVTTLAFNKDFKQVENVDASINPGTPFPPGDEIINKAGGGAA